jgi:predicted RNase H-like nuclease (RuvC/YqgF family)
LQEKQQLLAEVAQYKARLEAATAEVEALRTNTQHMQREEHELFQTRQQLEIERGERARLEAWKTAHTTQLSEVQQQNATLLSDLAVLRSSAQQQAAVADSSAALQLEKERAALQVVKNELTALQSENSNFVQVIESLKAQLQQTQSSTTRETDSSAEIAQLKAQIQALEAKLEANTASEESGYGDKR